MVEMLPASARFLFDALVVGQVRGGLRVREVEEQLPGVVQQPGDEHAPAARQAVQVGELVGGERRGERRATPRSSHPRTVWGQRAPRRESHPRKCDNLRLPFFNRGLNLSS